MWLRLEGGNLIDLSESREIAKVSSSNEEENPRFAVCLIQKEGGMSWRTVLFSSPDNDPDDCDRFLNWLYWQLKSDYAAADVSDVLRPRNWKMPDLEPGR